MHCSFNRCFDTTTTLLCQACKSAAAQHRCKSAPAQYKSLFYLVPPQSLTRKQFKTKLMFCKTLFIIHVKVKGLFKAILQYKNEVPLLQKCMGMGHP